MEPLEPRVKRLAPQTGIICSPRQMALEDVPVIIFDIAGGVTTYIAMMRQRFARARAIGSVTYQGRPITPHKNPSTAIPNVSQSGCSYHIVQLINSHDYDDASLCVQLLISDFDLYLVGFRRRISNIWSDWFRFSDCYVPHWFQSVSLGVDGHHTQNTNLGNETWLQTMFYNIAQANQSSKSLKYFLLEACVLLCEAMRLLIIYKQVVRRLACSVVAYPLDPGSWDWIHAWGHLSQFVLESAGNVNGVVNPKDMKKYRDMLGVKLFREIVARRGGGNLLVLMRCDDILLDEAMKNRLAVAGAGANVLDPGF